MNPARPKRNFAGLAAALALGAALVLLPRPAAADVATTAGSQFHFRMGMVSGNYSANSGQGIPITDSFSVSNSLDAEFEHFTSSHGSLLLRTTFVYDLSKSQMMYAYTGVGKRWYFWSSGMQFADSDGADTVTTTAQRRYYFTAEGGISEAVVKSEGNLLVLQSSDYELGGNLGVIQQMGRTWGLEAQAGYAMGFGFSTTAVGGSIVRVLLGVAVYF